ncbi:MAG: hypothetical protein ACUZ8H_01230 [Candidatus Anammoxibacter sp.]
MGIVQLKTEASRKQGTSLRREIEECISRKKKVFCKGLNKRPVFLIKYLEATNNRRDKTRRRQLFFAGLKLIVKVKKTDLISKQKTQLGISCGFKGITPNGVIVNVHIREESTVKDKKLFLVSTF